MGVFAGLISGAIVFATLLGMTLLFHNALMLDPSNIHEFALNAHRAPTQAELSKFLYTDAQGGALNMMWIGPLLGITLGGLGAVAEKLMRLSDPTLSPLFLLSILRILRIDQSSPNRRPGTPR